ncbi:MAG: winged helix-turn-helix transcriptional regulator [Candidatus Aenigmarchaeota archaeon]|nr:winged helix-turn-helix transcriptional regulator [Candidatus Aenigmarchaeota archaeon]
MPEVLDKDSLRALSAGTRQDIVKLLKARPYTASELSKITGKHVTTISEHLDTLCKSGIIEKNDTGNKWLYYRLSGKGEKLFKPQYYSWVVVLTISIFGIFFGLSEMLGMQGYAAEDMTSKSATIMEAAREVPASNPAANYMPIALTALSLAAGGYATFRIIRSRNAAGII